VHSNVPAVWLSVLVLTWGVMHHLLQESPQIKSVFRSIYGPLAPVLARGLRKWVEADLRFRVLCAPPVLRQFFQFIAETKQILTACARLFSESCNKKSQFFDVVLVLYQFLRVPDQSNCNSSEDNCDTNRCRAVVLLVIVNIAKDFLYCFLTFFSEYLPCVRTVHSFAVMQHARREKDNKSNFDFIRSKCDRPLYHFWKVTKMLTWHSHICRIPNPDVHQQPDAPVKCRPAAVGETWIYSVPFPGPQWNFNIL